MTRSRKSKTQVNRFSLNDIILRTDFLSELSSRLDQLKSSLYVRPSNFDMLISSPAFESVKRYLDFKGVSLDDKNLDVSQVSDYLDALLTEIKCLPVLRVCVARADFPDSFWQDLHATLGEILYPGRDFLLDVSVDESILGGIQVFVNGRVVDLSLRPRLHSLIEEELAHVLK